MIQGDSIIEPYSRHAHDVLVIGAGGAGLRAAIEATATGTNVGIVCKSLLSKAHTVMAEGGIAAALGNLDPNDNWRVEAVARTADQPKSEPKPTMPIG